MTPSMTAADGTATTAPPSAGRSAGERSAGAAGSGAAQTFTGRPADTRWGVVQVRITVQNAKIVSASAPVSPHGSQHSLDINKYAVPILDQEAVKAGSARIDTVSGATVTSGGYVQSLQSAIDMAHL
jgi:uncharacterized protein with FMN-binding domain